MSDSEANQKNQVERILDQTHFFSDSEPQFLSSFASMLQVVTGTNEPAVLTLVGENVSYNCFSTEVQARLAELLKLPKFTEKFHETIDKRTCFFISERKLVPADADAANVQLAMGAGNEAYQEPLGLPPAFPGEAHFFVPTYHENPCRSVVWLTKEVADDLEALNVATQLRNLALTSLQRQTFLQRENLATAPNSPTATTAASATSTESATTSSPTPTASAATVTAHLQSQLAQKQAEINALGQQNRSLNSLVHDTKRCQLLSNRVSKTIEKEQSAFQLAGELREFLNVDRITVIDLIGEKYTVIAVSGQPTIDKRSNIIRSTEAMVASVGLTDEPTFFGGDLSVFPNSIHTSVQNYLNESLAASFALLPLNRTSEQVYESEEESLIEVVNPGRTHQREITGAILVEQIKRPLEQQQLEARWSQVREIVENQHNNSKTYSELLFLPIQQAVSKFFALYRGHTKRTALAITGLILAVLLVVTLVPADFRVRCEGVVEPDGLHEIYSPEQATVLDLLVQDGQEVKQGDVLVRFVNREVESKSVEVQGELEVLKSKRRVNQRRRISLIGGDPERRKQQQTELAQEASDLELQINEKEQMVQILQRRSNRLTVTAPCDGRIMGWNLTRRFSDRTLEPGTRLFSIAPTDAPWVLNLKVPDQRSGYINQAFNKSESQSLDTSFTLASQPSEVFEAQLKKINPGLEEDSDLGYALPVQALPTSELPPNLRSGTPVVAKVKCGRRSILYCKTYEFLDWANQILFEYVY